MPLARAAQSQHELCCVGSSFLQQPADDLRPLSWPRTSPAPRAAGAATTAARPERQALGDFSCVLCRGWTSWWHPGRRTTRRWLWRRIKTHGSASMFWSEKGGKGVRRGDQGECCRGVIRFPLSSRLAGATRLRGRRRTFAGGAWGSRLLCVPFFVLRLQKCTRSGHGEAQGDERRKRKRTARNCWRPNVVLCC